RRSSEGAARRLIGKGLRRHESGGAVPRSGAALRVRRTHDARRTTGGKRVAPPLRKRRGPGRQARPRCLYPTRPSSYRFAGGAPDSLGRLACDAKRPRSLVAAGVSPGSALRADPNGSGEEVCITRDADSSATRVTPRAGGAI